MIGGLLGIVARLFGLALGGAMAVLAAAILKPGLVDRFAPNLPLDRYDAWPDAAGAAVAMMAAVILIAAVLPREAPRKKPRKMPLGLALEEAAPAAEAPAPAASLDPFILEKPEAAAPPARTGSPVTASPLW